MSSYSTLLFFWSESLWVGGWIGANCLNSSDGRLGGEGEELEEVSRDKGEDEDAEDIQEAGVWDGYVDGEVGLWGWRWGWSWRDMVSGYEARSSLWVWRLDFGIGNGFGGMGKLVYDEGFGRRPYGPDGDCTLLSGFGMKLGWDRWAASDGCTLAGSRAVLEFACIEQYHSSRPASCHPDGWLTVSKHHEMLAPSGQLN